MIRRLLAAYRTWTCGWLLAHLWRALREPKEPPQASGTPNRVERYRNGRHPAATGCRPQGSEDAACCCGDPTCDGTGPYPDPAPAAVHLPAVRDEGARSEPTVVVHQGSGDDDATSAYYAGLRADDTVTLDPDEQAWEEAWRRAEGVIDVEAARGRRRLYAALERLDPGWQAAICQRPACANCVHDFSEAMAAAGVIALPAVAVDWSTGEYAVVA